MSTYTPNKRQTETEIFVSKYDLTDSENMPDCFQSFDFTSRKLGCYKGYTVLESRPWIPFGCFDLSLSPIFYFF